MAQLEGSIVQCIGAVVDIEFPRESMPSIYEALVLADTGETGLADGSRHAKTDRRVEAIGEIDELNCALGVVLTHPLLPAVRVLVERVQHELFELGGELSFPGATVVDEGMLASLDAVAAEFNAPLPSLREFVLPGGSPAGAAMHLARAVARRRKPARRVSQARMHPPASSGYSRIRARWARSNEGCCNGATASSPLFCRRAFWEHLIRRRSMPF